MTPLSSVPLDRWNWLFRPETKERLFDFNWLLRGQGADRTALQRNRGQQSIPTFDVMEKMLVGAVGGSKFQPWLSSFLDIWDSFNDPEDVGTAATRMLVRLLRDPGVRFAAAATTLVEQTLNVRLPSRSPYPIGSSNLTLSNAGEVEEFIKWEQTHLARHRLLFPVFLKQGTAPEGFRQGGLVAAEVSLVERERASVHREPRIRCGAMELVHVEG